MVSAACDVTLRPMDLEEHMNAHNRPENLDPIQNLSIVYYKNIANSLLVTIREERVPT